MEGERGYTDVCDNLLHSAKGRFLKGLQSSGRAFAYPPSAILTRLVKDVHAIVGFATLGMNVLAAGWGGSAWMRKDPSVSFWYLLRTAQLTVVVEVVLGLVLLAQGKDPPDQLHYVYAVAPLVIAVVTEAMRASAASSELDEMGVDPESLPHRERVLLARRVVVREIGIMTVGLLLIVTLLLRAALSGGAF
jgi:hypothetical protein